MKHIFLYVLLLMSFGVVGQTGSKNYVLSRTFKQTGASVNNVSQVQIQVNYMDALGRPQQSVQVAQSPTGKDVIVPTEYDGFGREIKKYLPYTVSGGNGTFQSNATTAQRAFYFTNNSAGLEGPNADLDQAYSETKFEDVPSGRVIKQRGAGLKSTDGSSFYGTNNGTDVKRYIYSAGNVTTTESYPAGRLFKKKMVDEEGKEVTEFTDFDGLLICKKAGSEFLTTYYVYDDLKRLRAVLQPQYQEPNATLAEFAFLYDYDSRGRMISKKVPGSAAIEMVYDNFDRLALSRDGNQTADGKWAFTKYDIFNRVILQGEISSNKTRSEWQSKYDGVSAHHETVAPGTTVGYSLNTTSVPQAAGFPQIQESNVLNISYYDNYSFTRPTNLEYSLIYSSSKADNVRGYRTGGRTKMLTGQGNWLVSVIYYDTEYRVIQTVRQLNGFATDAYERVATKYKYNIAPVIEEQTTAQYVIAASGTGSSEMRTSNLEPDNLVSTGPVVHTYLKQFQYDHADRLLNVKEKLTLGTTPTKSVEAYTVAHRYNELGQLREKWQHSTTDSAYRRKTSYTYNIRGWITDGNTEFFAHWQDTQWFPFFRYQLFYQKAADLSKYSNGNISKMEWKGQKETSYKKGLQFSYDGVNRLTSASNAGGSVYTYAETETGITYDKNGNIKTLTRGSAAGNIDQLTYNYGSSPSNKLNTISDGSGNAAGVKTGLTGNYSYDNNGNMTRDMGRNATLTYNYLNLPATVKIGTSPTYTYEYDASGVKHKYVADSTFKYEGAFEYNQNSTFKRLAITDGQVMLRNGTTLELNYYIKDHLGNNRVVFDDDGKTLQQTDYYPFGLEIDRNPPSTATPPPTVEQTNAARNEISRYLYNGKELQSVTNFIDFGARMYVSELGRWTVIDPLSERSRAWSTYTYCINNPLRYVDPDGRDIVSINGGVSFTGNDAKILFGAIKEQVKSSGGVSGVHLVRESKTPSIYKHTLNAFRSGKPERLHYDGDYSRQKERRKEALKNYPSRGDGTSRDEYPYASTFEGGAGAMVAYVPKGEQDSQGGSLGALYKTLKQGDEFLVLPVPRDREPDAVKEPVKDIPIIPIPISVIARPVDRMLQYLTPLFSLPIFVFPEQQYDTEKKMQ